jgi:hypothetical protein
MIPISHWEGEPALPLHTPTGNKQKDLTQPVSVLHPKNIIPLLWEEVSFSGFVCAVCCKLVMFEIRIWLFNSHTQEPKLTKPKNVKLKHMFYYLQLDWWGREGRRNRGSEQAGGPFPTLIFVNFRVGRQTCVAQFWMVVKVCRHCHPPQQQQ